MLCVGKSDCEACVLDPNQKFSSSSKKGVVMTLETPHPVTAACLVQDICLCHGCDEGTVVVCVFYIK